MKRVAILGASYAGLTAAQVLDDAGIETAVFEKKTDIKDFDCGEIYTSGKYGISRPPGKMTHYPVKNLVFHFDGGDVIFPLPLNSLWVTDRGALQEALYNSISKRVGFNMGEKANIAALREEFDYVIDASGHIAQSSKEGFFAPIKEHATALFYRVEGDFSPWFDDHLHFWWLRDRTGYFWIFPQKMGHANVGIGWEITDTRGPTFKDLDTFFSKVTGGSIGHDYGISLRGGGILPLDRLHRFRKENILVVGEAAGLMNYTFGAGVEFAIASGREAAKSIVEGDGRYYEKYIENNVLREVENSRFMYRRAKGIAREKFEKLTEAIARTYGMDIYLQPRVKLLKFFASNVIFN